MNGVVRAAGGIVLRWDGDGPRIALVHRPGYDDWTLPKGKLDDGESDEQAALREVREETGLRCVLDRDVGAVTYVDRHGRPKVVRYWTMTPAGGSFVPTAEVDELRWAYLEEALGILSYPHDRELVENALGGRERAPVYLLRHAKAGARDRWTGPDQERPLTRRGRRQAIRLVDRLQGVSLDRIVSSPFLRCLQSIEPLAGERGIHVETSAALGEGVELERATAFLRGLDDRPTLLCGHGREIEALVRELEGEGAVVEGSRGVAKGSMWVLDRREDRIVAARYLPAPPG